MGPEGREIVLLTDAKVSQEWKFSERDHSRDQGTYLASKATIKGYVKILLNR